MPIQVICEQLGVPYADRDQFRAWSEAVGDVRDRVRSEQGLGALLAYGQRLVAGKREQPGDDFISRLCAAHYCLGAPLARIELQAVFSQLLARFPGMRLAVPVEELRVRSDTLTGGLTELPVAW